MESHSIESSLDVPLFQVSVRLLKIWDMLQDIGEVVWNKGLFVGKAIGLHTHLARSTPELLAILVVHLTLNYENSSDGLA